METLRQAEIGVFGGSGFYSLLTDPQEFKIDTPYGPTSDTIALGEIAGRSVAFMPRHGKTHQHPPHTIPFRANIWAMKQLGVTRIIAPTCVGSLQPDIKPGDFVVSDQFVDRTSGRKDTFYDGPITTHVSSAETFCPALISLAVDCGRKKGITMHHGGTVVVIQGPRFSSKAESLWFTKMEWSTVNMTVYPECILALEQEICYVNIALVTDYDAGIVALGSAKPVNTGEVTRVLEENNSRVKDLIVEMISRIPSTRECACAHSLANARIG